MFINADEVRKWVNSWKENHIPKDGFLLVGAFDGDKWIGTAGGWKLSSQESLYSKFSAALSGQAEFWLNDCFYFSDLAVIQDFQRSGVAKNLLKNLFQNLKSKTSLLLAQQGSSRAYEIYLKNGWIEFPKLVLASDNEHYRLLGKSHI